MRLEKIENRYSKLITDYLANRKELNVFYNFPATYDGLEKSLRVRQFNIEKRKLLVNVLNEQYRDIDTSESTEKNIKLLEHTTTYTVTTGHQLSLFTGPLFFIYKIISTIKLCEELKEKFPLYNFVPIYWMASEDHDFEEINHFHLFGKKYEWNTDQSGAVGEFNLGGIETLLTELGDEISNFKKPYLEGNTLSEATIKLVNDLFKDFGLVILEPNNKELKRIFTPIIRDELIQQKSNDAVEESSKILTELGYKAQVNPREINLFYLDNQLRKRIVYEDGIYKVLNSDISFSEKEILELLENSPEKFSPNVVLRPIYQEYVLPNLAYIGGPGEIAYWLQLKSNFDRLGVYFPVLILRDSFLVLNKSNQKVIDKLDLKLVDLFKDPVLLKKELVKRWSEGEISLAKEIKQIEQIINSIKEKTDDKSLYAAIEAEFSKVNKGLENLEKRIHKAEERKHETSLNQLDKMHEKLFPVGMPQERYENVLNYLINDTDFISKVYEYSDVIDNNLKVLYQE